MLLGSRKARSALDEAALLYRAESNGLGIPEVLAGRSWSTWQGTQDQRELLIEVLELYQFHGVPVRDEAVSVPAWSPAPTESRRSLAAGLVVLHGRDGERLERPVQALLDANVVLARVAKLHRSWQLRERHAWSEWDSTVAWAEEQADPHGGLFDLPASWRGIAEHDLPLFGWRVDLAWGARPSAHGVPVVRMRHALGDHQRHLPLFDAPRCFKRGQTPGERLRTRPLRLAESFEQAWVHELDVADRRAVVEPIARLDPAAGRSFSREAPRSDTSRRAADAPTREIDLELLLRLNPDIEPLIAQLRDQELVELRRRVEAHAAAGGVWVVGAEQRERTGAPWLPLSGWHLAPDAFVRFSVGEVRLAHPQASAPLVLSARAAITCMREHVDPREVLYGDPCADGGRGRGFLRQVDAAGCHLAPAPAEPATTCVRHSVFLRANPDLVGPLLEEVPEIGIITEDAQLAHALRALAASQRGPAAATLDALAPALDAPTPWLSSTLAQELAREVLERQEIDVPLTWLDADGHTWRWVALDRDEFVFRREVADVRALPGPTAGSGVVLLPDNDTTGYRLLKAWQLPFASPALARALHSRQVSQGVLDENGDPRSLGERLRVSVQRGGEALDRGYDATLRHMALARELREDPRKVRGLQTRLERLDAARAELRAGRWVRAWVDDQHGATGIALSVSPSRPAGEDRLRLTDGIQTRFLGRFRLVLLVSGDPAGEPATGALVSRLADEVEGRVAGALVEAVDPDDALDRTRDAILEAAASVERPLPFCSLVALLTHHATGATGLLWSGNSGAWRYRGGALDRLSWDQTADGVVQLGLAAGLRPADAVSLLLHLTLRRSNRRELEATDEAQLLSAAERFTQPLRRRALRAGLGGARAPMVEEQERLRALLKTYAEAYGTRLASDPIDRGAAMLFVRRIQVRPGDRIVLGSRGFSALVEADPLSVIRALSVPDAQRAAERLTETSWTIEDPEDLAVVVLAPPPTHPWEPTHVRRQGTVFMRTPDQSGLLEGGVVPPSDDGTLPALRVRMRLLGRHQVELDELLNRRRLPDPARDPAGFIEGVAAWALAKEGDRPPLRARDSDVRDLHDVLEERDDDPADETLLTLALLRKRGFDVQWVTGLRAQRSGSREQLVDTCWLEIRLQRSLYVLDLGISGKPTLREAAQVYGRRVGTGGRLARFVGAQGTIEYLRRRSSLVEVPVPEAASQDDPWLRLTHIAAAAPPAPADLPVAPQAERPTPSIQEGWLDLE